MGQHAKSCWLLVMLILDCRTTTAADDRPLFAIAQV